ncbi:MAG: hypothetical protein KJ043_13905, partial [Anaerolineae bacterium]|nr:hypothetical protein [Anaerolineae bacterium]
KSSDTTAKRTVKSASSPNIKIPLVGFLALIYFMALAIFITAPLIGVFSTHFNGDYISDLFMTNRHVWWIGHAIQTGQNPFFQPLLAYPNGLGGAYLWGTPFEYFPAWLFALFMPLPAASNLQLLMHITLNGWVVYLLAQHLTRQHPAGFVAGTVFAIAPAIQGRIYVGHALIVLWIILLGLYALYHLKDRWRWSWAVFGAICIGLSAGGSLTLVVFYIAPLLGWFILARMWSGQWAWFGRTMRVLVMSLPIWAILFIPLFSELPQNPELEQGGGHVLYSADLLSIISPSPFHPTWNDTIDYPAQVLGANLVEGATYIGIVGGFLALMGILGNSWARSWLRLGIIAWIFSLGPLLKIFDSPIVVRLGVYETYIPLPWALFEQLPFISSTRAPARWGLLLALCVAMMAGYGMLALLRWSPKTHLSRWGMTVVLILMLAWDYPMFYPMPQVSAELPQALYDLADRDDVRAVFNIPYNDRVLVKQALYMQVAHQHPILAGMMYRDTPVNPAKLALLQATLDPALLDEAGADVVIVQKTADGSLYGRALSQLGAPVYEDANIAIFDVPIPAQPPTFIAIPLGIQAMNDTVETYLYAPQAGTTWVEMDLSAYPFMQREAIIYLNNTPIHRITIGDSTDIRLPLVLDSGGFYTLKIALTPACPAPMTDIDLCVGASVFRVTFGEFSANIDEPVAFSLGIDLLDSQLSIQDNTLWIGTVWYASRGIADNTLRFIHITDSTGSLVAQNDGIMAVIPNNSTWADGVILSLPPDLPSGTYTVSL